MNHHNCVKFLAYSATSEAMGEEKRSQHKNRVFDDLVRDQGHKLNSEGDRRIILHTQ
jgi:hypothetical protein